MLCEPDSRPRLEWFAKRDRRQESAVRRGATFFLPISPEVTRLDDFRVRAAADGTRVVHGEVLVHAPRVEHVPARQQRGVVRDAALAHRARLLQHRRRLEDQRLVVRGELRQRRRLRLFLRLWKGWRRCGGGHVGACLLRNAGQAHIREVVGGCHGRRRGRRFGRAVGRRDGQAGGVGGGARPAGGHLHGQRRPRHPHRRHGRRVRLRAAHGARPRIAQLRLDARLMELVPAWQLKGAPAALVAVEPAAAAEAVPNARDDHLGLQGTVDLGRGPLLLRCRRRRFTLPVLRLG
mmetsp:Transcript_27539/g.85369  ORF Transcript_27539/g.85369 Transcript_27539/m.85369 type:complete len:292 (-) Transcript_27539:82-957(-)